jgi:hypothetical protein
MLIVFFIFEGIMQHEYALQAQSSISLYNCFAVSMYIVLEMATKVGVR